MSISAREQQVLAEIEETLSGSDPRLASRLTIFARLTAGEEMPSREAILIPAGPQDGGPCWDCPARAWSLTCLLLWLAASVSLIATALALN